MPSVRSPRCSFPNSFHYLNAPGFLARYPRATLRTVPGLHARCPSFPRGEELSEQAPPAWSTVIEHRILGPVRGLSEAALFHRPSATLIVTDLAFHMLHFAHRLERAAWRLSGVPAGFGPSRTARLLLLHDRAAAAAFLERVLAWPFERVLVAHRGTAGDERCRRVSTRLRPIPRAAGRGRIYQGVIGPTYDRTLFSRRAEVPSFDAPAGSRQIASTQDPPEPREQYAPDPPGFVPLRPSHVRGTRRSRLRHRLQLLALSPPWRAVARGVGRRSPHPHRRSRPCTLYEVQRQGPRSTTSAATAASTRSSAPGSDPSSPGRSTCAASMASTCRRYR